jgi:DNA helicase-2/ATP-dependent DNA helicase PcrA
MSDLLAELNEKQREAALHTEGPLLVIAGAGTGKTKTVTHRIARLIKDGVPPEKILAITFTNKAAKEMRERTLTLLGLEAQEKTPFIATFHGLGVHILKEYGRKLGRTRHFSIYDRNDSLSALKKIIKNAGFADMEPRKVLGYISRQKGKGMTVNTINQSDVSSAFAYNTIPFWRAYEQVLREQNAFDFDDLLLAPLILLRERPEILSALQDRWSYIHIDEYQDTNVIQNELVRLLSQKHTNVCAVGDADQAIYSWRGASFENILNFADDFPGATIVPLLENYRSTKNIIAVSNAIITKNKNRHEKELFTSKTAGPLITIFEAEDDAAEARYVGREISGLLKKGVAPSDIAVLYRANFQSRVFEEIFFQADIPYELLGTRFFERKEVKDMLAFIRAAQNRTDWASIERIINIPPRGIGKVTLAKIAAGKTESLSGSVREKVSAFYKLLDQILLATETMPPDEVLLFVVTRTNLEATLKNGSEDDIERLENIYELIHIAQKYKGLVPAEAMEAFLTDAMLFTEEEMGKGQTRERVKLMTVHAAKGLEFGYVFVVGLEEDLFPHKRIGEDESHDNEEERRLFYVALTRAKHKLYITHAQNRTLYGTLSFQSPSSFLADIESDFVEHEGGGGDALFTIRI